MFGALCGRDWRFGGLGFSRVGYKGDLMCIDELLCAILGCRLQPVKDTREKQVQLWKELILKYCKHHKCFLIDLEAEFPLFENTSIQSEHRR